MPCPSRRSYVLLACLLLLGGCASPSRGPDAPPTLRVLAYNIKHGRGMDGVVDLARTAAVIRRLDPDVVTLQEVDEGCARSGDVDQAAALGEALGMHHAFGPFMDYDGGRYGMALLSKRPFASVENLALPSGPEPRTALAGRIVLEDGTPVVVVGIHLYATEAERLAQAQRLTEHLAGETAPVILAGDFNSTPDSPVMAWLGEVWRDCDKGTDRLTFNSTDPDREIDYLMVRPPHRWRVSAIDVVTEPLASDHRPLWVDLVLEPRERTVD